MSVRLSRVREVIKKSKVDAALIASVGNIFYLSGLRFDHVGEGYLLIGESFAHIYTNPLHIGGISEIENFEVVEINKVQTLEKRIESVIDRHNLSTIAVEFSILSHKDFLGLQSSFKGVEIVSLDDEIGNMRVVKDQDEVKKIEKSCKLNDLGYEFASSRVEVGITEKELAWQFESFVRSHGGEIAFSPIVAFGKNSAVPHHASTDKKLEYGDNVVLIDVGTKLDGYCSDLTRVIFVGDQKKQIFDDYSRILELQKYAIEGISVGMNLAELDKIVDEKRCDLKLPKIPHSLGHGLGIEIHESPFFSKSETLIENGMVMTVEPGIYKIGEYGIRIEDTIVIENNRARCLSSSNKDL